jgi:hypothetical protein
MVKGTVRVNVPSKPFKNKNKLDVVRKRDIMHVFVHLNRHKIAQERCDTTIKCCLCYLLKLNKEPSDESALLFKKFSSWFFTNRDTFNKLDKKYTPLLTFYIEKLGEIKDKYDNDLRHECYFYDVVDDIFAAIKDIDVIKKVLKDMILKQNKTK